MFRRRTLPQLLIYLIAIPTIALLVFSTLRVTDSLQRLADADRLRSVIEINQALSDLATAITDERGAATQWIKSSTSPDAFQAAARVDQRVPKKLLLEQGAPTAADKRKIQDGVEEMHWVAALKPNNIGVPAFRNDVREYLEIAVLTATLRAEAKESRLIELLHRAIPYPLLLVAAHGGTVSLSLAHKRWSQGETGKVVIEDVRRTASFQPDTPTAPEAAFLATLALSTLPVRNLFTVYQGWLDRIAALEAANITGTFTSPDTPERASAQREGLDTHAQLLRDLAGLRAQAQREKQLNRRVGLNLEIKRLEFKLAKIQNALK